MINVACVLKALCNISVTIRVTPASSIIGFIGLPGKRGVTITFLFAYLHFGMSISENWLFLK